MWILPTSLRGELKKPLGPVLATHEFLKQASGVVVSVGDVVTATLLDNGIRPKLMIVDDRSLRAATPPVATPPGVLELKVKNPPATITAELHQAIVAGYGNPGPVMLRVEGEEDLAVIPAVLLAPDGARVSYGQPGEGVVLIRVDAAARARVRSILDRMEVHHRGV